MGAPLGPRQQGLQRLSAFMPMSSPCQQYLGAACLPQPDSAACLLPAFSALPCRPLHSAECQLKVLSCSTQRWRLHLRQRSHKAESVMQHKCSIWPGERVCIGRSPSNETWS